jgi:ABC-type Mn2+/Zn2+ transport system permease subunit
MTNLSENYSLILALATALAAGVVGSFALMKRMTLASDVVSHIALPGLGIALLLRINPIIGGATTLLLGTILIWKVQNKSNLNTDAAIGVVFVGATALGTLLTPSEDLIGALFGGFGGLSTAAFALGLLSVAVILIFMARFRYQLILSIFSRELAAASGIKLSMLDLAYLLVFSLNLLLGLRFLGAILVGALLIIPAAIGRQLSHTLSGLLIVSSAASVFSVGAGFFVSDRYHLSLGPVIVTIAAVLFALSLLKKKT